MILSIITDTPGQVGQMPRRVKMMTTDDFATITTANYLNEFTLGGNTLQKTDILDVVYSYNKLTGYGTYDVFLPTFSSDDIITLHQWDEGGSVASISAADSSITLTPNPITESGTVSVGLVPLSKGGTGQNLTAINNSVFSISNSGNAQLSTTLPTAVQANITQLGNQSQALNMNSHLINNVLDPLGPQDAATKSYVDQNSLNGTSVYAATTISLGTVTQSGLGVGATLTNAGTQATFSIDGVSPPLNSNVLIKNNATGMTAANQGIYTVSNVGSNSTNWVLTRATTYDTPTKINTTGLIVVQNGSVESGTAWYNANPIVTVDTTDFDYTEFGGQGVQPANTVYAGPTTGADADPTFRALVGTDFPAAQSWTPEITPNIGAFDSITYSTQLGRYLQLGNMVFYALNIQVSGFSIGTASSQALIVPPVNPGGGVTVANSALVLNTASPITGFLFYNPGSGGVTIYQSDTTGIFILQCSDLTSTFSIESSGYYFTS